MLPCAFISSLNKIFIILPPSNTKDINELIVMTNLDNSTGGLKVLNPGKIPAPLRNKKPVIIDENKIIFFMISFN